MNILELNLRHFGKFEDHTMTFHPGINIVYGPNESGKTTLHAFIRAMFFGFSSQRGRAGRPAEYELRKPWTDPAYYEGSMRVEYGGKVYRIERVFNRHEKNVRLIGETDARELTASADEMNALLMGMNEAAFVNTVFIRQGAMPTDDTMEEILRNYMMRMKQTGDGALNLEEACGRLLTLRKQQESAEKEEKNRIGEQIAQKEMQLEMTLEQLERQKSELRTVSGGAQRAIDVPDHSRESAERGSYRDEPEKVRRLYAVLTWMCALAAFLGCICALVTDTLPMRLMMLALAFILFAVTGALSYLRPGRGETASPDKEPEEREDPDLLRTRLLGEEISKTSRQAAALREELNGLYDQSAAGNRHASEREAIDLALERIRSLSDQICLEAGDDFDENASFILSALTDGRYTRIAVDEKRQIRVECEDGLLGIDQISAGTADQVYFAMRLAAGELMSGENLPLIMDDPFRNFDDARLEAALRYLEEGQRQVILFTGQKREARILEKIRA